MLVKPSLFAVSKYRYIKKEMCSDLHGYAQKHEALAVFVSGLCSAAQHIPPVAFS